MPEERLQKVLAASGVASRRAAEAMIEQGRVRVDGRVARIGERVDPERSAIEVDGIPVGVGAAHVHLALHKPGGVTSTTGDRHAERTVLDLVPTALVPDGTRLYPVGRLDQDSEGLILLTNDGAWSERVLHPRFGVEREYAVALRAPLTPEQDASLRRGVVLDEGVARLAAPLRGATPAETRKLAELIAPAPEPGLAWYRAVLVQGWKRQLRRMFAAAGAPVVRLVRVRIGTVRIDGLPSGRSRRLKAPEVRTLGAGEVQPRPDAPGRRGPAGTPRAPVGRPAGHPRGEGRPDGPASPANRRPPRRREA
jgi:23S rRNA pseudouridine2605 synthase